MSEYHSAANTSGAGFNQIANLTQFSGQGGQVGQIQAGSASTGQNNTANIKGKLANQLETITQLTENLNAHKKEVQILRSEKETLESVLTMKCNDT